MPVFRTLLAAGFIAALPLPVTAGEVMLQYFESRWQTIEKKLPDAFVAGYSRFWFPPPGKADTGGYSVGYDVYDRFNLGRPFDQTLYGTEAGAKQLVRTTHAAGMKAYFDYIMNHNGFRDSSTPGFAAGGDYPGFATTLPGDVDGDFHSAYAGSEMETRLAGLIDIAQEKNHLFIRQPAAAGAQNIPNEAVDPGNRRFYPDLSLAANSMGVYPFNAANPLAGDPVLENATGLLLRNAQWMVETIGADGFRMDAVKHVPTWFFNDFFDKTMYQRGRMDLAGNATTPYSFGEAFTSDFNVLGQYRRKDAVGNRDVLDFPLFFTMRDVFNGGGFGDMRLLENASVDAIDGNANDGSAGVMFAHSHDEGPPSLDNVAYAHILTRTGLPVVYFNAQEFGSNRDFPKGGRGDALGGDFGNLVPRLVDISRRYAKGEHRTRSSDENVYVYERSNSLLVALNDRGDSGYDQRTVATDFRNVVLTELTGAATDPVVNANGDLLTTISIGNDGLATIRVPRNRTNSTQHNHGFVMYGAAPPSHTQTLSPVSNILPPEPSSVPNGSRRMTPLQVISTTTFSVTVQGTGTVFEDNALLRLDAGLPIDADAGLLITTGEFGGFEAFTGAASPRESGGTGTYYLDVDTSGLSEGMHFLETVAFLPRPPGSPSAFSSVRTPIYLDRVAPPVQLTLPTTTGTTDVQSQSYTIVAANPDFTADAMHIFFDQPVGYNFLGNTSAANRMTNVDRGEFRFTWNNITNGSHSITIVAYEQTGNSSVTRFEPVGVTLPQPNMAFGIDTNSSSNAVNFQPLPGTISDRAYANDFVIRVDQSGGRSFPADFDVYLDVDGQTYTAVPYNISLLPPVNRLVQNDQNLSDGFDEFRFVWRGYGTGNHSLTARAQLKAGGFTPNSIPAIIGVPESVTGPAISITSPAPGTGYNAPTSLTLTLGTDLTARSVQAFISQPGGAAPFQLLSAVNTPNATQVTLQRAVSNYLASDTLSGLNLLNGVYTLRAVAATGLDGGGISREAVTTISVTGYPDSQATTTPLVEGDIREYFDRAPLAVSAADGAGPSPTIADFGSDGSLTELHARILNNTLYLAVRGDMFNGANPAANATIVYLDLDTTAGTGAKSMDSTPDLGDSTTPHRQLARNSGFNLNASLISQGIGFDAAIVVDGTDPLSARILGFGSAGVAGTPASFAELSGAIAFGRGFGSSPGAAGTSIAGPSGFEVSIPLNQLANANPLNMAFAVVTTSDSSFPSPNTLPENAQNTFDATQVLDAVARFPTYPALLLNEVYNGEPDWVEIYNPTASSVSLTNWALRWTDASGVSATLPLTGANVASASYPLGYDGTLPTAPPAGSVAWSTNIPWHPDRAGSAALLDPYGISLDYVRWNSLGGSNSSDAVQAGSGFSGHSVGFNGAGNRSLSRNVNSSDSDAAGDWVSQPPTPGTSNVPSSSISDWMLYR